MRRCHSSGTGTCPRERTKDIAHAQADERSGRDVGSNRSRRLGDKASRADFNDAMLLLFENIGGFETLAVRISEQLLDKLWQRYQVACGSTN